MSIEKPAPTPDVPVAEPRFEIGDQAVSTTLPIEITKQIMVIYRKEDKLEGQCAAYYLASLLEEPTVNIIVCCLDNEFSFHEAQAEPSTILIFVVHTLEERYIRRLSVIANPVMMFTLDVDMKNSPIAAGYLDTMGSDNLSLITLIHFIIHGFDNSIEANKDRVMPPMPTICNVISKDALGIYQNKDERWFRRVICRSVSHEVPTQRNWKLIFKLNELGLRKMFYDFGEKLIRFTNHKHYQSR